MTKGRWKFLVGTRLSKNLNGNFFNVGGLGEFLSHIDAFFSLSEASNKI